MSRFDDTLEHLLSCLEPVVMAEQNFCLAFFKMDSKVSDTPMRPSAAKTKTQKQVWQTFFFILFITFSRSFPHELK